MVARRRRRARMIECVRRQSGSRLPSMVVVVHLQNCTWRTSPFMRAKRTRRWHISKSTSHGACNEDVTLARMWADAGRGHADAHVQRLPCSEVLQRRSPKDGFEKSRIGRESVDGAAQGYLLCMIECESESESARARARTHEREEFIDNQQVTAQSVSKTLSPVFSRRHPVGQQERGGGG